MTPDARQMTPDKLVSQYSGADGGEVGGVALLNLKDGRVCGGGRSRAPRWCRPIWFLCRNNPPPVYESCTSGEKSEVDLTGSRDTFCHPEGVTRQEDRNVSAVVFQRKGIPT